MIRTMIIVLVSLSGVGSATGQTIISVDSAALMLSIALLREGEAIEARLSNLRGVVDSLQVGYDSLRVRANELALAHNYEVREVERSTEQLVPQQKDMESMMKVAQRQAYWMDRYIRSADFVRYRTYYTRPKDKWANRIFWGGNAAIVSRIALDFIRDN